MTLDAVTAQRMQGIIVDLANGRTVYDGGKQPISIWDACAIPVGSFTKNGDVGYVLDIVTAAKPDTVLSGKILMSSDSKNFAQWCLQNSIPLPDGAHQRRVLSAMMVDPKAHEPILCATSYGEVESGVWVLTNGVMYNSEFIPMAHGQCVRTSSGTNILYVPDQTIDAEEACGNAGLTEEDSDSIVEWANDFIALFNGSCAPLVCAAWVRASVMRGFIEQLDSQIPALYIAGDSHRGKTLMSTVATRMLGGTGRKPNASAVSSSFLAMHHISSRRSCLPMVIDELKPYDSPADNDFLKSLVNGDRPRKMLRNGTSRESDASRALLILTSESLPADVESLTNRLLLVNLSALRINMNGMLQPDWMWSMDKHSDLYTRWSHSIFSHASGMTMPDFVSMWKESTEDAITICHDARILAARTRTAITVALIGFRLMNMDAKGKLSPLYQEYCRLLSKIARSMANSTAESNTLSRYFGAITTGWPAWGRNWDPNFADMAFKYQPGVGVIVSSSAVYSMLRYMISRAQDKIANKSTLESVMVGAGFTKVEGKFSSDYYMNVKDIMLEPWGKELFMAMKTMDAMCYRQIKKIIEEEEPSE